MNFSRRSRKEEVLDITPLIDVIFQLVLFFMVSTTFITSNPGIEVDLPQASADVVIDENNEVQVWVTREGAIYLGTESVSWDTLKSSLRATAQQNPGAMVIIKADGDVDHSRVVAVMDLARSLGLGRLAIATNPGEE